MHALSTRLSAPGEPPRRPSSWSGAEEIDDAARERRRALPPLGGAAGFCAEPAAPEARPLARRLPAPVSSVAVPDAGDAMDTTVAAGSRREVRRLPALRGAASCALAASCVASSSATALATLLRPLARRECGFSEAGLSSMTRTSGAAALQVLERRGALEARREGCASFSSSAALSHGATASILRFAADLCPTTLLRLGVGSAVASGAGASEGAGPAGSAPEDSKIAARELMMTTFDWLALIPCCLARLWSCARVISRS